MLAIGGLAVDHEDVGDLHDAGWRRRIAAARLQRDQRRLREFGDLISPGDADRFKMTSRPNVSISSSVSAVAPATPPRWPRLAIIENEDVGSTVFGETDDRRARAARIHEPDHRDTPTVAERTGLQIADERRCRRPRSEIDG